MKKAVLLVSFGSADNSIRKKFFDKLAAEISAKFTDFEVRQAFTSLFIIKKLATRGILVRTPKEEIARLREEGFKRIIILPTHLTAGEEFDNKIRICAAADVDIIPPIMGDSLEKVLPVILSCFRREDDEDLVLVGHGSPHRHNPIYEELQRISGEKVHIGVIEATDKPNFEDVVMRLKESRADKILLAPLLFNGGVHVKEDIAGDWFDKLTAQGYKVRIIHDGLGSFEEFRELYIKKLEGSI